MDGVLIVQLKVMVMMNDNEDGVDNNDSEDNHSKDSNGRDEDDTDEKEKEVLH